MADETQTEQTEETEPKGLSEEAKVNLGELFDQIGKLNEEMHTVFECPPEWEEWNHRFNEMRNGLEGYTSGP